MTVASCEIESTIKTTGFSELYGRKTRPLYVVCSPIRGVGKTLVSRLLTEMHFIDEEPVTAFDLADEGPQMVDFLPGSNIRRAVVLATQKCRYRNAERRLARQDSRDG